MSRLLEKHPVDMGPVHRIEALYGRKLPDILDGQEARGGAELLLLARMCEQQKKHHTAFRLYAAAFQAEPESATIVFSGAEIGPPAPKRLARRRKTAAEKTEIRDQKSEVSS